VFERTSAIALARRARPPLGIPQPQGRISPATWPVCRIVSSIGSLTGLPTLHAASDTTSQIKLNPIPAYLCLFKS
jgi:hypothetical protein